MSETKSPIHHLLDWEYGPEGDKKLRMLIAEGEDVNGYGPLGEMPIHAAARRRRLDSIRILLELGADMNSRTKGGKTAYAHCARRGFTEICEFLESKGADTALNAADEFAVAVVEDRLDDAAEILAENPGVQNTGIPEEDRLFADVAGRAMPHLVEFLIEAGADLTARGLDDGTPLHQAAWFGEPDNAELLIEAGAPLDIFDKCHESSPLHWAVHGSRYSGDAEIRQSRYMRLVEMLLDAGSSLNYPGDDSEAYVRRLYDDATEAVREVLRTKGVQEPG
ncbi:MAG: ankyrin repeat domain-containing protein [Acidobacteria bacterium]|nr:MAG: ankyrin repeat domain-containing protein [Acidobacteriota bacterium]REK04079.1 MAG: ankyrin repeat domain-containing protein [Acidobacteriota bacterium]REK15241.1 MAG: ankyrin repeat domain-containing protein [Acidobacteriota bacterium]REK46331.1 MAG: ankyrin repeat domain-containing protein [Acidobacteriota bacterium]